MQLLSAHCIILLDHSALYCICIVSKLAPLLRQPQSPHWNEWAVCVYSQGATLVAEHTLNLCPPLVLSLHLSYSTPSISAPLIHLPPVFPSLLISRLLMKAVVQRRRERGIEGEKAQSGKIGRSFGPTVCLSKHVHPSVSLLVFSSDVIPSVSSPQGPQHSACSLGFLFMFH